MELVGERFPRLSHLGLDGGYNGEGKGKDWAEKALRLSVEAVRSPRRWVLWVPEGQEPPPWPGFTVLPRRWVVERTFSHGSSREPQAQQGLREAEEHERGVRLRGHDALDGQEIGTHMRLFRRFLSSVTLDGGDTDPECASCLGFGHSPLYSLNSIVLTIF